MHICRINSNIRKDHAYERTDGANGCIDEPGFPPPMPTTCRIGSANASDCQHLALIGGRIICWAIGLLARCKDCRARRYRARLARARWTADSRHVDDRLFPPSTSFSETQDKVRRDIASESRVFFRISGFRRCATSRPARTSSSLHQRKVSPLKRASSGSRLRSEIQLVSSAVKAGSRRAVDLVDRRGVPRQKRLGHEAIPLRPSIEIKTEMVAGDQGRAPLSAQPRSPRIRLGRCKDHDRRPQGYFTIEARRRGGLAAGAWPTARTRKCGSSPRSASRSTERAQARGAAAHPPRPAVLRMRQ